MRPVPPETCCILGKGFALNSRESSLRNWPHTLFFSGCWCLLQLFLAGLAVCFLNLSETGFNIFRGNISS